MDLAQDELNPLLPHPVEILMILFLAVGPVAIAVMVFLAVRGRARPDQRGPEARPVAVVRWTGLLLGAVVGFTGLAYPGMWWTSPGLGVDLVNAPIAFGLVVLLATMLGELVVRPRFETGARTADLRPRVPTDFLPRGLAGLVATTALAAVVLCTFTWATASMDDMGREGRSLMGVCSPMLSSSRGPYPGSFYVLPYAIGAVVALVLGGAAAWHVTRRPLAGTPVQADHHRRTSMRAITGAVGVVISAPLVGIAFFAGTTLLKHSCAEWGWVPAGWSAVGVACLALVTLAASLVALLAPAALRPADREPERVDA